MITIKNIMAWCIAIPIIGLTFSLYCVGKALWWAAERVFVVNQWILDSFSKFMLAKFNKRLVKRSEK
jgi:hypothetical protein